jgi:hypothetical protein
MGVGLLAHNSVLVFPGKALAEKENKSMRNPY